MSVGGPFNGFSGGLKYPWEGFGSRSFFATAIPVNPLYNIMILNKKKRGCCIN